MERTNDKKIVKLLPRRVGLIIQDELLREIISLTIGGSSRYQVVAAEPDYTNLASFIRKGKPEAIIMDLQFGAQDGIEAVRQVRNMNHNCHVMILSEHLRPNTVFAALKAGASGYILRSVEVQKEIVAHLDELCNGGAPLSSEIAKMVVQSHHLNYNSALTPRELQVLQLLAEGKTYTEISEDLMIAAQTSKGHIRNIYAKLKVNSKREAIAQGIEMRIVYHSKTKSSYRIVPMKHDEDSLASSDLQHAG